MTPSSVLLSALIVAAHLAYGAHAQQVWGKDIYWNGPYVFLGCEPYQGAALKALFKQIGILLSNDIIPDAELGSASKFGFKTWFSTNSASVVSNVYQDILDGEEISTVTGRAIRTPAFVCVNNDTAVPELQERWCSKGYIAGGILPNKFCYVSASGLPTMVITLPIPTVTGSMGGGRDLRRPI